MIAMHRGPCDIEETVRFQREILRDLFDPPVIFSGFRPMHSKLLSYFERHGGVANQKSMYSVFYGHADDGGPCANILSVHMVHLRRALKKHGVAIKTIPLFGWEIDAAGMAIVSSLPRKGQKPLPESWPRFLQDLLRKFPAGLSEKDIEDAISEAVGVRYSTSTIRKHLDIARLHKLVVIDPPKWRAA